MNRKMILLGLFGGVFTAAVSCSSNDGSESSEAGGTSSTTGGGSGSGGSQVGVGVSGSTASSSGGSGGNMMSGSVASGGSGGNMMSGSGGSGGSETSGGSGGSEASGGSGGGDGGAGADQCKPIGWATRSGRDGGAFNVTGGGDAEPIVVNNFADLLEYAEDGEARVIHIDGALGGGWSGKSGDRLEIKSNKTIVGLRAGTQLKAAIHIKDASNVILRNIVVRGPGSNGDQAWDNISIEGNSKNIWVDHAEFWDGQDGNADVVKGADNVTFTWTIFGYSKSGSHNLSNLIASSDNEPASEGKLNITFMFNWWTGVSERQPRCRYGRIHVVNNLYTADTSAGPSKLGVTNGFKCNVLTENNHFIDQSHPIDLGKQAGEGSVQEATGNLFESCSGNQEGSGDAFEPPYEYKSFMVPASEVKELVQAHAGATLSSPTACSP
ncbi:pectate lyase family protein [Sorangium sp. So ce1389]|uniref:pectate lyase family protein n=1 Tax=Sorangium sp. So ce1389 TaxID=3133336 RepID=UPI003F63A8BE